ncbi:MAG: hypothetical protein EOP48_12695 [Sphingobacteriales bacterium]|nr:MAG: hypothetical protein EOP48_12695 [Sphingobacteriales bacterium]
MSCFGADGIEFFGITEISKMTKKHSYMDESENSPDPKPVEKGTSEKDQKNVERTDPGLKKGYNEKNPTQPQGGFTPDSQSDDAAQKTEGDESR